MFTCTNCDAQYAKWTGKCLECGKWGTIIETKNEKLKVKNNEPAYEPIKTTRLSNVEGKDVERIKTEVSELDRVLGGGIVPGSLILLGGEPGVGKSTLALQLALTIPNALYISGEESVGQIKMRADRLFSTKNNNGTMEQWNNHSLRLANETNIETICTTIAQNKPVLAVIDSIQTIHSDDVAGGP